MLLRNVEPFERDWFEAWQTLLLIAINSPIKGLREEVRNRLGINLDRNILVNRLLENSFRIKVGMNEYQETFYGKNVFAKSIHQEFMWLWKTIHKWDMNFANHLAPKLNLGFDTLTVSPDANPEPNTVDGYVSRMNASDSAETFAQIRSGAGTQATSENGSTGSAGIARIRTSTTTGGYFYLTRGFFLFVTSALTSAATITASEIDFNSGYPYGSKYNNLGSFDVHIASSNPASNTDLAIGDYNNVGSTSFGSKAYDDWIIDSDVYNVITLNSTGMDNISKTSISKFSTRLSCDINNVEPTWTSNSFSLLSTAFAENSTQAPKLVVTYSLPTSSKVMII